MATSDKVLGASMLALALVVFGYYTTWALLLPFLPSNSPLQLFFPAREWAVRLPLLLLLSGLIGVSLFFGRVALVEAAKKKRAAGKAA